MPIIASVLGNDFALAREAFSPKPKIMGRAYADAITAWWGFALGPLGGTVIATPANPTLASDLEIIFDSYYPTAQAVAGDVALAVDVALKAVLIVGGADGALTGPIAGQTPSTLQSGIFTLWDATEPAIRSITQQEADLIFAFTVSGTATTTGIPPGPPGVGAIS